MFDGINNFIFKRSTVYTLADFTSTCWISTLNNKAYDGYGRTFDITMEDSVVIFVAGGEGKEVFTSFRA